MSFLSTVNLPDQIDGSGTITEFPVLHLQNHLIGIYSGVVRGAQQVATIGYWIDQRLAGNRYVPEAVVVLLRFAFEQLHLHRVEICIVPRNANSRRVVEVLALREEGVALRFLEINGVWEDHIRYAITAEEWQERSPALTANWL